MNLCTFTGNLTSDPESKGSGSPVTAFNIANNDYKDKPEYIPCVAFAKTAELIMSYCHKGSKVLAIGRWSTNKWTDKEGNERKTVQLLVDRIEFLTPKSQEQHEPSPGMGGGSTGDDVPF